MNILFTPNDHYVMPCLALLESLYEHESDKLDIWIITSSLSRKSISLLEKSTAKNNKASLHLLEIPADYFADAQITIHFTKEIYYRLLAQKLLPQSVDRILYLDLDIIVTQTLKPLYNMDFDNNYMIVCEGPGVSKNEWSVYDALNIPYEYKYFNAGVLLLNLSLMRQEVDPNTVIDYVYANAGGGKLKYCDQDTLNALYYDKVKYVDWHKYNQTIIHIKDKNEADYRLKTASIIHYAGSDKPWKYDYSSWYMDLFWKYARKAGFRCLYIRTMWKCFWWHVANKIRRK